MIIKYTNTREDYEKEYGYIYKSFRLKKLIRYAVSLVILMLITFYYISIISEFYIVDDLYVEVVLILTVIYIIFCLLSKRTSKINCDKFLNNLIDLRPNFIGEKSIEISGEYIIYKSEKDITKYKIKAIDKAVEKDDKVVVYVLKTDPLFIIPCSAFESESDKNEFLNLIN